VISGGVIRPSDRAIVVGVAGEAGRGGTGTS